MNRIWIFFHLLTGFIFFTACDEKSVTPIVEHEIKSSIINDTFEETNVVIYYYPAFEVMVAYKAEIEGQPLEFSEVNDFPVIMQDQLGNQYNIFGEVMSGPNQGAQLEFINQMKGYWFAIASFYPEATLYYENTIKERLEINGTNDWLVPSEYIVRGALPNAIPAINSPRFETINGSIGEFNKENNDLSTLSLVIKYKETVRVYPERTLEFHEIVNDQIDDLKFTLSYCPLTSTGTCWIKTDNDFYVSGLLYNANLILSDWNTGNLWSQIYGQSINGTNSGQVCEKLPSIEMNSQGKVNLVGTAEVLSLEDELPSESPYAGYKIRESVGYPVSYLDDRLPNKERVLAIIIDGKAKVYRTFDF